MRRVAVAPCAPPFWGVALAACGLSSKCTSTYFLAVTSMYCSGALVPSLWPPTEPPPYPQTGRYPFSQTSLFSRSKASSSARNSLPLATHHPADACSAGRYGRRDEASAALPAAARLRMPQPRRRVESSWWESPPSQRPTNRAVRRTLDSCKARGPSGATMPRSRRHHPPRSPRCRPCPRRSQCKPGPR